MDCKIVALSCRAICRAVRLANPKSSPRQAGPIPWDEGEKPLDPEAPVDPEISSHKNGLAMAVAFGEDYGLLFTASPEHREEVMLISEPWAQPVRIGAIDDNTELGARLHGLPWPAAAFSHFGAVS